MSDLFKSTRGVFLIENENFNEAPVTTKFGYTAADNLPASVDLTAYLPPIGN